MWKNSRLKTLYASLFILKKLDSYFFFSLVSFMIKTFLVIIIPVYKIVITIYYKLQKLVSKLTVRRKNVKNCWSPASMKRPYSKAIFAGRIYQGLGRPAGLKCANIRKWHTIPSNSNFAIRLNDCHGTNRKNKITCALSIFTRQKSSLSSVDFLVCTVCSKKWEKSAITKMCLQFG